MRLWLTQNPSSTKQRGETPIAIARTLSRQLAQPASQAVLLVGDRRCQATLCRTGLAHQSAGPALGEPVSLLDHLDRPTAPCRAQNFPSATSFSAAMSSAWSATIRFRRGVLVRELLEALHVVSLHGAVLVAPAVIGLLGDLEMAADRRDVCSFTEQSVCFSQLANDLLGGVTPVLHLDHPPSAHHRGQEDSHRWWIRWWGSGQLTSHAVILATGVDVPGRLDVPGEAELIGAGVVCRHLRRALIQGSDELVVIGGGNSALEEGLHLSEFADRVRVLARSDLSPSPVLQPRVRSDPKFVIHTGVDIVELGGSGQVFRCHRSRSRKRTSPPVPGSRRLRVHRPRSQQWLPR